MREKKYNATLDMLKGLSCLLVITIHVVFPGIFGQLVSKGAKIAVPIFFMISGFYSGGTQNQRERLFKKAVRIFLLLIISLTVYSGYYILRNGIAQFMSISVVSEFILRMNYGAIGAYHLWFLMALTLLYAAHCCLYKFIDVKTMRVVGILSVIGIILLPDVESMEYIKNTVTQGITFYSIGWLIKNDSLIDRMDRLNRHSNFIGCCFLVVYEGLVALSVLQIIKPLPNAAILFIYIVAISFFVWALKNPKIGDGKLLTYIGRELSLIVYIVHLLVNEIVNILFYRLYVIRTGEWPNWWLWPNPICVIIGSLICAEVMNQLKVRGILKWKKQ